jgi:hypothetical protein
MARTRSQYRLISQIPTNAGRTVHLAESAAGQRVLVKQAESAEWAADLARQARHFQVMAGLLGPDSPYPPVLDVAPGRLVLPFYEHGSLDDLTSRADPAAVQALLADALSHLMKASVVRPRGASPPPPDASRAFLARAAQARLDRLDQALATPDGRRWAGRSGPGGPAFGAVIGVHTAWLRDPVVLDGITKISPARLPLAGHGDFALGNILLTGMPGPAAGLVFIDVHGQWHQGCPWWDPVADLAILIGYSCQVRPALARAGELPRGVALGSARPAPADVTRLAAADPRFTAWAQYDRHWRARLEIAVAIRLLGNISVQLVTAPANPGLRAAIVLGLYASQVRRISPLISQLRSGATPAGKKGHLEWATAS